MQETGPAILELGVVLLLAAAGGWAARRVRLPAIVGYLIVGLAISPFTPGYVADRAQLQLLADIGVVILLFEVGIEVDVRRLGAEQRSLAWAVPLQVIVTTAVSALVLHFFGVPLGGAALVGLAIAISSGVVVVNVTRSRRRTTDARTEQALLGWSVLQDVTAVILASVLLAAVGSGDRPFPVAVAGIVGFGIVALLTDVALPVVLRALRKERDLFLIVSVAVGLGLAGVGAIVFGLPVALAAFIAGLAISDRPESAEARRQLLPFRDLLAVLFFVLVGTLIDPGRLPEAAGWLVLIMVLLVVTKVLLTYALARFSGVDARPLQLAIGLGQLGEFSYVFVGAAAAAALIDPALQLGVLAAIVLSIGVSSVAVRFAGRAPPPVFPARTGST